MAVRDGGRPPILAVTLLMGILGAVHSGAETHGDGRDFNAVVLVYHHVSDATPEVTSVTPALFQLHLDLLEEEDYRVVALDEVVAAVKRDGTLPPRAVAITFDDAYESVYREALPRLEERQWPFTVFVSTDAIDRGYAGYMDWSQLRDIERRGGRIANHSASHAHLVRREADEPEAAWRRRIITDIGRAQARLEAELDSPPMWFAYPYGEFDRALETVVADLGYTGFGQQSGPIGPSSTERHLPRFPVAGAYAAPESLAERLRTRPLPVTVLGPDSRIVEPDAGAPELRLRPAPGAYDRNRLRCFVTGQEPAEVRWQADEIRVRARSPLRAGRSKFNCTAPSTEEAGTYYWYSHLWIRPHDDGSWYPD